MVSDFFFFLRREREVGVSEKERAREKKKKVLSISQNIEWDQRTCQEALAWIWMMREEQGGLGGLGGGGRENKPNFPCQPHSRQIKHSWDTSAQTLWWQNKRGMQPDFTQAEGKPAFTAIHVVLCGDNGVEEKWAFDIFEKEKVLWFCQKQSSVTQWRQVANKMWFRLIRQVNRSGQLQVRRDVFSARSKWRH